MMEMFWEVSPRAVYTSLDATDWGIDVLVAGAGMVLQEFHRCHDQTCLTVTTLGNILLQPCLLHRV